MRFVPEVSTLRLSRRRWLSHGMRLTGRLGVVGTGVHNEMDIQKWDKEAMKTMFLIHQSHSCDKDKGIGLRAEDIARPLLFLVSDRSKGINGAILPIDNAWSTI